MPPAAKVNVTAIFACVSLRHRERPRSLMSVYWSPERRMTGHQRVRRATSIPSGERTESPRLQFKPVYVGIPSLWSRAPRIVRVDSESRLLRRFSTAPLPVLALCSARAAFARQQLEIIFPMYSRGSILPPKYKRSYRFSKARGVLATDK